MGRIITNPSTGNLEVDDRATVSDLLCVYRDGGDSLLMAREAISKDWQIVKYRSAWEAEMVHKTIRAELLTYGEKAMMEVFNYYKTKTERSFG